MSRNERVSCESCTYYIYDEDYESYVCDKNMDEDEYIRLMTDRHFQCPFYRNGDEYAATIVAHIIGWMMNMQLSVSRCSILLIV